jgi:alkanesulfonate monooxygenase SsuD/methylene tetrahydromethanopterin reductase-like flavin-dependent oxidoreductase (luciferase family)
MVRRVKIGIVVPQAEEEDGRQARYRDIRDAALQAEAGGLDSVWVYDHLIMEDDGKRFGIWEAFTLLTALAEATERVELGTIVLATAFRNPAVLAKMAATLDEVSGGRLILGVGAGWYEREFRDFGIPFDHLVGRFEESLAIITGMLRTGRADVDGRWVQAHAELRPTGPRPDGMPILVAGTRPRMMRLTARHADQWNVAWLGSVPTLYEERHALLVDACRQVGRDPTEIEVNVGLRVTFDAPPAEDPTRQLHGTVEEVAEAFRRYAALGAGHLVCALEPTTTPHSVEQLCEAARLARAG